MLVAAIAREFGAGRVTQPFAAVLAALRAWCSPAVACSAPRASTAGWLVAAGCAVRLLRTGDSRWALGVGLALGVGRSTTCCPRCSESAWSSVCSSPGRVGCCATGGCSPARVTLLLAVPNPVWQAAHGFPQLGVAASISDGDSSYSGRLDASSSSSSSSARTPYRSGSPAWRAAAPAGVGAYRAMGWAWLVVVGIVLVAGGKGYYDAPLLLVLTAAGAVVTVAWASAGRVWLRRGLLALGVVLFLLPSVVLLLPVLPADRLPGFVVDVNYDAGETIGWPAFADSLAAVHRGLPPEERARAVVLTGNYGEAGAVARFGPARGLPRAYSGHNSMVDFGRPPADADVVIAVGWERPDQLNTWFEQCAPAGRVDQRVEVENDENGGPIFVCRGLRRPWAQIWDTEVRHTG